MWLLQNSDDKCCQIINCCIILSSYVVLASISIINLICGIQLLQPDVPLKSRNISLGIVLLILSVFGMILLIGFFKELLKYRQPYEFNEEIV